MIKVVKIVVPMFGEKNLEQVLNEVEEKEKRYEIISVLPWRAHEVFVVILRIK